MAVWGSALEPQSAKLLRYAIYADIFFKCLRHISLEGIPLQLEPTTFSASKGWDRQ